MATANQRLKQIYLMKVLFDNTDETHSITMPEIVTALNEYGISAERKSIYDDIEALRVFGMDIIGEKRGRTFMYHVGSRDFELAELKLLVDAVQSSKFITAKKSNELISKIEKIASKHEAKQLQRQVFVSERIKTMNESIYYNVDIIHSAIANNAKIRFQYFQWNVDKQQELRHAGEYYLISPWALTWDDENYYMIGYDHKAGIIKHYRVDKMLRIEETVENREGRQHFRQFDMAVYAKKMFGMFDGEEQSVRIECDNSLAGVMIDRFGKSVSMIKKDEDHFVVNVTVAVSRQFFGWIISLGSGVVITEPENVVEQLKEEIRDLNKRYGI
ncbi:MAG: WYL domain-containing protein [Anaerostipes sp.]|nr:WYL domain-containing protein [Anaerostipes sp.]